MQLLVVAATEMEIAPLRGQNIAADFLITGVGSPGCLYKLVKAFREQKYDCVVQAGIAGTFNPGLIPGDTVLVNKDVFADLGIIEKKQLLSLFDTGLADKDESPYKNGWLVNENNLLSESRLRKVTAVTVHSVSDDLDIAQQYVQKYQAEIESMEGAAFHYVCLLENIPFIQIRSISNPVGERDKLKWQMKKAINNLNTELFALLTQITTNNQVKNFSR